MARLRSTGLGKTEITANISNIRIDKDLIIMEMQATKPVRWMLRAGLQPEDRRDLLKALLKLNVKLLKFLFHGNPKKGEHPEPVDF